MTESHRLAAARNDADYYDYYALGSDGDIDFYVSYASAAGGPVLELGCGTGRVLLPMARAGARVVGLDFSPTMLAAAATKLTLESEDTRSRVSLVEGDMRTFCFNKKFALIVIPYRSFQNMLTPADQCQCLKTIAEHLSADGSLIFDVFDPDIPFIASHKGPLGEALKLHERFFFPPSDGEVFVWETSEFDLDTQTLTQIRIFEELTKEHVGSQRIYSGLQLRYTFRFELEHVLQMSGFKVMALYSDFKRSEFRTGRDQVWIARPKASEA